MTLQQIQQFLSTYGKTLFAVAVVAIPILSGIIKEVSKNAAKKRAALAIERQKIEEMRRGKAATATSNASKAPNSPLAQSTNNAANQLEEMARQRRQQAEQTRGRQVQAAQAQAGSRVQQAPGAQRASGPNPNQPLPGRNTQAQPTKPQRPQPLSSQQAAQQRAAQQRAANQQRAQQPKSPRRAQPIPPAEPVRRSASESVRIAQLSSEAHDRLHDAQEVTHRLVPDVVDAPLNTLAARRISRNEWRRALVLREILSTPLSLREDSDEVER